MVFEIVLRSSQIAVSSRTSTFEQSVLISAMQCMQRTVSFSDLHRSDARESTAVSHAMQLRSGDELVQLENMHVQSSCVSLILRDKQQCGVEKPKCEVSKNNYNRKFPNGRYSKNHEKLLKISVFHPQ